MARWASGGIILSSAVIRYQLRFVLEGGSRIAPLMAPMPHGTWESAINAAFSASTSPAKEAGNFALSRNKKPSCGGSIGGTGALGGGSLISVPTDSPLSGAKAAMYTRAETFGWFPASLITVRHREWPTRIVGPSCVARVRLVTATSSSNDIVGFWTMLTL